MKVDIHADDYGYTLNTSKEILDCIKKGYLNSISIICNTNAFEESMKMLYCEIPALPFLPLMSVHICLPEGKGDILPLSWKELLFLKPLKKEELKKEIKRQIEIVNNAINVCIKIAKENDIPVYQKGIRLDSHVHTHPIPIVWKSLIEVIEEENYKVEYIRNSKEPLFPFLKHKKLMASYGLVNLLKNRILMLFSKKIDNYCDKHSIEKMYLWGLLMSGNMDIDRINILFKDVYNYACNHNRNLEILFHPGMAIDNEYSNEMNKDNFLNFNVSINRRIEKNALFELEKTVK